MLLNYFKLAFRNISRQKFYATINILGLAIGLAICLLILLFVKDELSYDKHHSKADQIYRMLMVWGKQDGVGAKSPIGPYRLQPVVKTDFPEIEQIVRFSPTYGSLVKYGDKEYMEERMFYPLCGGPTCPTRAICGGIARLLTYPGHHPPMDQPRALYSRSMCARSGSWSTRTTTCWSSLPTWVCPPRCRS